MSLPTIGLAYWVRANQFFLQVNSYSFPFLGKTGGSVSPTPSFSQSGKIFIAACCLPCRFNWFAAWYQECSRLVRAVLQYVTDQSNECAI